MNPKNSNQVDFEYKRCYIDKQGNYINPKTTWDDLLKYYTAWRMMVAIGDGTRRIASSIPDKAVQRIKSEKAHKNNQHHATKMQSEDLKKKESLRKQARYERNRDLEAEYLKQV